MLLAALILGLGLRLNAQATINFAYHNQAITGFGGGVTNYTPYLFPAMSSTMADTLFCTGSGQLGLSLLRVSIDPGGESPVPALQVSPNFAGYGWAAQMTDAQEAQACGAQVFTTPWSAPEAYTSTGTLFGGSLATADNGNFGTYMESYVSYMADNGVNLSAISLQNEPDTSSTFFGYTTWTASQFDAWLKGGYGSRITTRIMMPESVDYTASLADTALEDSSASPYIGVVGGHCYGGMPSLDSNATSLGIPEWETECNTGNDPSETQTWSDAMNMAASIAQWMNGGYQAYIEWMLEDAGSEPNNTVDLDNGFISFPSNKIKVNDGSGHGLCTTSLPANVQTRTQYTCSGTVDSTGNLVVNLYGGNIMAGDWSLFDSASLTVNGGSNLLGNPTWGTGSLTDWTTTCSTGPTSSVWVADSGEGEAPYGSDTYLMGIYNASDANDCGANQEVTGLTNGDSFTFSVYAVSDVANSSPVEFKGYAMGQYSKFVRPGYLNVSATYNPQSSVDVTAYEGKGNFDIVAVNANSSSVNQTFDVDNATISSFTPYVSSSTQGMAQQSAVSVTGGSFSYNLPASSIVTFAATGTTANNMLANPTFATGDLAGWKPTCPTGPTSSAYVARTGGGEAPYKSDQQLLEFYNASDANDCYVNQTITGQTSGASFTFSVYAVQNATTSPLISVWDGGTELCKTFLPANHQAWTQYACSGRWARAAI
jgi:O-glycosyl hydrolase